MSGRRSGSRSRSMRRSRSRNRGVGEPFKPIVDLIDTSKLARQHRAVVNRAKGANCARCCQPRQRREVCALSAQKVHDAAELLFRAPKAPVMRSKCAECAECAQTLNTLF